MNAKQKGEAGRAELARKLTDLESRGNKAIIERTDKVFESAKMDDAARRAAHDKAHPTLQSEIVKELTPPSQRYKPGEGLDLLTCYHMGPAVAEFTRQVLLNVATAPGVSPYPGSPLRLILDDMSVYLQKAGRL